MLVGLVRVGMLEGSVSKRDGCFLAFLTTREIKTISRLICVVVLAHGVVGGFPSNNRVGYLFLWRGKLMDHTSEHGSESFRSVCACVYPSAAKPCGCVEGMAVSWKMAFWILAVLLLGVFFVVTCCA